MVFRILYFEKKELFRLISFSYSILEMGEAKNRVYRVHVYKVKMRLVFRLSLFSRRDIVRTKLLLFKRLIKRSNKVNRAVVRHL